jgi:Tfp pilus assembly protein PilN
MRDWNFAPYRERERNLRKAGWCMAMAFGALIGGVAVAWAVDEAQTLLMQQQTQVLELKAQLSLLQQKNLHMQTEQAKRNQMQDNLRHIESLRQRGQDLLALHKTLALRWPAGVQIQELRLEGPSWRLQGQSESAEGVQQAVLRLTSALAWQQPPALLALEALPQRNGQSLSLRYVVQARWPWTQPQPAPAAAVKPPTTPQVGQ